MASCLKVQMIGGYPALITDDATPVADCTHIAVNASEYGRLAQGWISSREEADSIAVAVIGLFAVIWCIKMVVRSLNVADIPSDEKH